MLGLCSFINRVLQRPNVRTTSFEQHHRPDLADDHSASALPSIRALGEPCPFLLPSCTD